MPPLDPVKLETAISELAEAIRNGSTFSPELVQSMAEEYSIRPDVLRARFQARFPDGKVGVALPSSEENALVKSRRAAAAAIEEHMPYFSEIDGREILIDVKRHTIIAAHKSRQMVITFSHQSLKTQTFPFDKWKKLSKELPPA